MMLVMNKNEDINDAAVVEILRLLESNTGNHEKIMIVIIEILRLVESVPLKSQLEIIKVLSILFNSEFIDIFNKIFNALTKVPSKLQLEITETVLCLLISDIDTKENDNE